LYQDLELKDAILFKRLSKIRSSAKQKLKEVSSNLPEFTPHTIEHKERVLDLYEHLIPQVLVKNLNKYELFCLIASTYLHDIGLAKLKELDDTVGINEPQSQFIRDHHHTRTEEYVNRHYTKLGIQDDKLAFIIGRICRVHRIEDLNDLNLFDHDYKYKNKYSINITLLAGFLRIADELDMTFERTPRFMYERIRFKSPISKKEWEKSLSISGIGKSNDNPLLIKANGNTSDPRVYRLIKSSEKKINQQLHELRQYLHQYQKYSRDIPNRFNADIIPNGFIPVDFRFSLAERNIIQIMMGLGLYRKREEAIRELLKNAVDACQRRKELSESVYSQDITFEFSKKNKTLSIIDNGIGMNRNHIDKYLVRIGSSFYASNEFATSTHDYKPLSELGIGFLSAFMLSKRIEIETLMEGFDPLRVEIDDLFDYLILRRGSRKKIGTTVTIRLHNFVTNSLQIAAVVKSYARHLPFTIRVKAENQIDNLVKNREFQTSFEFYNVPDKTKYGFHKLKLNETEFEGIIGLLMINREDRLFPLPYLERIEQISRPVLISCKGISLDDATILPWWFRSGSIYVDLDFKELPKLAASRNRFIYDEDFIKTQNKLESRIIQWIASYLNELRRQLSEKEDQMVLTFTLFDSYINTILFREPHKSGEISQNFLNFFKKYYLFGVIHKGRLNYLNVNEILLREYKLIHDFYLDLPLHDYIDEIAKNSTAFNPDCNYVILTGHEIIGREGEIEDSFVDVLFDNKKLYRFKDFINVKEQYDLAEYLPEWVKLVKFENFNSDNIIDDISELRMLNGENNFIKLIIDNKAFFSQPNNKLILKAFLDKIIRSRSHYQVKDIIEYQRTLLELLSQHNIITKDEVNSYTLSEMNFPPPLNYDRFKKFKVI